MLDRVRDRRPHAIVIGAGFGGLAAAVRLGVRGYRVSVLDRLDAPGGRAYVHRQDGFTFDAGPTIVTAPQVFAELWELCGLSMADDVELKSLDPFYRIRFDDGETLDYFADPERMRTEVARLAPGDVAGFDRYLATSARIYAVAFEQLAARAFHRLPLLARSALELIRLGGYRSVYETVARHFDSERMRVAFSFHPLLIGGNPLTTTAYYCLIAHLERAFGVHYAVGGTGALVRGLTRLIEHTGGSLRLSCDVDEIVVESGRARGVRLAGGEVIEADIVVSNADSAFTYRHLLRGVRRRRWTDRRLARASYSMSLFVWYFGTSRRYESVYHHTMVLGPRYEGLLNDIFRRKVLAEDFSLYLHRPTASDPSLAPAGCDAFYVLAPVPHLGSGTDWAAQAEDYRRAIEERLEATLLPGLSQCIVTSRVMTPVDFRDRLCSVNGAAFSLEPRLLQSAWFRPHNLSEEVAGLYLVGAGTHPGAGLPGVVSSAKILDEVVPLGVPR
jgi:phytoene desaturase